MPAIGIQSRVLLKMSSNEYQREETGLKNILATANKLSDKFSFATNWILLYPGGNNELRTQYVVNLSYSISDKLGIFGESYGNLGNNSSTNFDGGISYLLNKDIQVDLSGGIQETKADSDYFIDFGFSWRTDWRK